MFVKFFASGAYIEKDMHWENESRNLAEVKEWLSKGSVNAVLSGSRGSFLIENIIDVKETEEGKLVIITQDGNETSTKGFGNNQRKLFVKYFIDEETKVRLTVEEARKAIERGGHIKAVGKGVITSRIIKIEPDDRFLTETGSIYKFWLVVKYR